MSNRNEDDLRAAFQLAAQDAPDGQEVLRGLYEREANAGVKKARGSWFSWWPASWRGSWLAPVGAAAAVLLAAGVIYAVVDNSGGNRSSASGSTDSANYDKNAKPLAGGADIDPGFTGKSGSGAASATSGPGQTSAGSSGSGSGPVVGPGGSESVPPETTYPSAGHTCRPDEVTLAVVWAVDNGSSLIGKLTATNHTNAACDLLVKPSVVPLGSNGHPIDVSNAMTAEGRIGPSRLMPGATTYSMITWSFWCGRQPITGLQLDWGTGSATASSTPQSFPAMDVHCPDNPEAANISSTWFDPLS